MTIKEFTRKQLARSTGCNLETIRYYEKIGLLLKPLRNPNGYRIYTHTDVKRLRFVLRARELGFTLEEIRQLIGLASVSTSSCDEINHIAQVHISQIKTKIQDLSKMLDTLQKLSRQCKKGQGYPCPIIEALMGEK